MEEAGILSEGQTTAAAPEPAQAVEAIIRAEKIEKYYAQPSQNRIQVISATDLSIVPGEIVALLGPSGSGSRRCCACWPAVHAHGRSGLLARETDCRCGDQRLHSFSKLCTLSLAHCAGECGSTAAGARRCSQVRRDRSMKMLDTVGLDGFEAAYPKELSGA